jgi:hypothetical protein
VQHKMLVHFFLTQNKTPFLIMFSPMTLTLFFYSQAFS